MATQLRLNTCNALGCSELIDRTALFCERHDRMLQSDIRTILMRKYRPGKRQSKVFESHLQIAVNEVLFCQTSGYRTPRDAEFEW